MRAASIAIISAIIATTAATTLYCVGQYFVFGAIFLEIGVTPFIAPGLPIMLGVGGFLNFYLLSRDKFNFEQVLRIYPLVGFVLSLGVTLAVIALDVKWVQYIGQLVSNTGRASWVSSLYLIAMSILPLATYIFTTNWIVNWLVGLWDKKSSAYQASTMD